MPLLLLLSLLLKMVHYSPYTHPSSQLSALLILYSYPLALHYTTFTLSLTAIKTYVSYVTTYIILCIVRMQRTCGKDFYSDFLKLSDG